MKFTRRLSFLLATFLFLTFPITAFLCGAERWEVKVGQDAHVKYLSKDFDPDMEELIPTRHTTIAKLHAYAWPFGTFGSNSTATTATKLATYHSWEPEQSATVQFTVVRDSGGSPIRDTVVMIHAVPAHSMIYEGKTGGDGKVVLTGIPYGKATVEAGGTLNTRYSRRLTRSTSLRCLSK